MVGGGLGEVGGEAYLKRDKRLPRAAVVKLGDTWVAMPSIHQGGGGWGGAPATGMGVDSDTDACLMHGLVPSIALPSPCRPPSPHPSPSLSHSPPSPLHLFPTPPARVHATHHPVSARKASVSAVMRRDLL